jgi:hypothetical protein
MLSVPLVPILESTLTKSPRDNRIPIMMSHEELAAIDEWRFANRVATRSDAIRRLCQIGIGADEVVLPKTLSHLDMLTEGIGGDVQRLFDQIDGKEEPPASVRDGILDAVELLKKVTDHVQVLDLNLRQQKNWMDKVKSGPRSTLRADAEAAGRSISQLRDRILARLNEGAEGG